MCEALPGGHGGKYAARHCIANLVPRLEAWTAFVVTLLSYTQNLIRIKFNVFIAVDAPRLVCFHNSPFRHTTIVSALVHSQ